LHPSNQTVLPFKGLAMNSGVRLRPVTGPRGFLPCLLFRGISDGKNLFKAGNHNAGKKPQPRRFLLPFVVKAFRRGGSAEYQEHLTDAPR
jgi:hypothetical protein